MTYTLDQYSADCRAALLKDPGPPGRELVRQYTEKACTDPVFVAKYLGPDAEAERKILYDRPRCKREPCRGTFVTARAVAARMKDVGKGAIVNTASGPQSRITGSIASRPYA